jgi:MFS family permease
LSMLKNRTHLVLAVFIFLEILAGIEWGIHRGLSSLFARQVLLITSYTQIGYIVSIFGLSKAVTNLVFGAISDRVGRKPVIMTGIILTGLGGALIGRASNYAYMLLGTALIGVGGGATFVGIMVSMTETLPLRIGLSMGLFELAAYGGSSIGTYVGGKIAVVEGLRYPFIVIFFISAFGAVSSYFLTPETRMNAGAVDTARHPLSSHVKDFVRILPLSLAGFSSKIMDSLMISFLPLYLIERGVSLDGATTILSAFTLSWALLQPLTGHLSDRAGRKTITVLGLFGSSVTLVALSLTSNYLYLVFLALFLGFEAALFYTPLVAMVSDIAPSEVEGTLIGSYRFFRDMGYFIGPILLGKIADVYKLDYSIYLTSLIILVAVIVLLFSVEETNPLNHAR